MGTITVNGRPLAEVVSKESAEEILKTIFDESRAHKVHGVTRHNGNTSGARTKRGYLFYRADQKEQKVIIKGQVFNWKDKGPFPRCGKSVLGAIELTADESEVKCAVCGDWVKAIDVHVKVHKLTARQYRIDHGLSLKSKLCAPIIQMSRHRTINGKPFTGKTGERASAEGLKSRMNVRNQRRESTGRPFAENDNLRLRCEAQRIADLQRLAKSKGRTPTSREMNSFINVNGLKTLKVDAMKSFFGVPLGAIMLRAGLEPGRAGRRKIN